MACTKFGARVLDNLFLLCTLKQKGIIAGALGPREDQLNANPFGKFLATKYGVHLYKRDPKEWAECMGKGKKKKEALDHFVADLGLDLESSALHSKEKKRRKVESS
jgi:hypothetical protein